MPSPESNPLRALRGLSGRLVEARRLDDLLWNLARSLGDDFGFPDSVIYLRDGDELVQHAAFGPKNPAERDIRDPIRIPVGQGITGSAVVEKRSICVRDVREDPRYIEDVFGGLSELAVPIVYGDEVLGVIDSEADEVGFFGEAERTTLEIVANMIAPRVVSALEQERRRLAESHLERSRARFLDLADSIDGIVWEADPETLRFLFVSRRAEHLLGYPLATWLEDPGAWREWVHPEDRDEALRSREETGDESRAVEYRLRRADGETVWVRDIVSTTTTTSGAATLCGVMVDVSEQRSAHERVLAASHAKSEFLANMSHELRTPMSAIVGLTELLAEHDLPAESRAYLDLLSRSAVGLLGLFDDLLDLSRIEAGKIELHPRPFDLRELLDDILAVLRPSAREKGLPLESRVDPAVPAWVTGDALRLRQILLNLVGNAIKFTGSGSVELSVSWRDSAACLRVRDTGPGIPADQADAIFEKFRQVDSSTARSHGGVGLGLAICRHLAELMGGRVTALPSTDGAIFELCLPLPRADAAASRDDAEGVEGEEDLAIEARVLLVEDNPVNQLVAQATLESLGCQVTIAESGIDALERLASDEDRFDLVFMDCQMPGLDGYETTRRIRHLPGPVAGIRVVAMTAHAMAGDRERCLDAGMDDYLAKPVRRRDLRAILARYVALP